MNRLCYRVIFSKTLNKLIVVSEKTSAQAKSGSRPSPNIHIQKNQSAFLSLSSIKPTSLYLAILLGFVSHTTYANIIADPTAPNTHKPIIVAGTNTQGQKVPVVQIRTPVNGVSHNKYSQFDVAQVGVVLNNSRAGTPTHLAGMIGANPFLQQGEAHTLINEINSSKISQLSGNIEIAGQKANLIIANPNGINVQGLGFINVHNATLSTGLLRHDNMDHQHHVSQGKIIVNADAHGQGFSEHQKADYVNLYARAIEVNAKIHANDQITIVTGSNQVDSLGQVSQIQANGTKPQISLDVKSLGGMHADSIYLVGTEKGLGVHHSGILQANHALIVTQEGRIENTGKLQVTDGGMMLSSKQDLIHQGNTTAKEHIQFNAQNIQLKQGVIQSQNGDIDVQADQVDLQNTQLHTPQGSTGLLAKERSITTTQATIAAKDDIRVIALKGNISHHNSGLRSTTGHVISSAYNKQSIHNSSISAANTTLIENKNQDLVIADSTTTSGKSAIIYSGGNQATTNSSFIANQGVLSNVSIGKHTITGEVQYTGSGVVLNHQSIDVQDDSRLTARAAANTALGQHQALKNINGGLSIETKEGLILDVDKHDFHASHDIAIRSKDGKLTLQGKEKQNQPRLYTLNSSYGGITLAGTKVELQGGQLTAKTNIDLYATDGDVYISDMYTSFNRRSNKHLQKFNEELKVANKDLASLHKSQEYKIYQQTLSQLLTEKNALISPRHEPENTIGSSDNAIEYPTNDPLRAQAYSPVVFRSAGAGYESRSVHHLELLQGSPNPEKQLAIVNKKIEELKKKYATLITRENQLSWDIKRLEGKIAFFKKPHSGKEYSPNQLISQQGNIGIYAKQGIVAIGGNFIAKQGTITLEAQGVSQTPHQRTATIDSRPSTTPTSILLSTSQDFYEIGQDGRDYHHLISLSNPTTLVAGKDIRLNTTGNNPNAHLVLQGTKATAKGNIDIKSNHGVLLDVGVDYEYSYSKSTQKGGNFIDKKITVTKVLKEYSDPNVVELRANNISLYTQGRPTNALDIYGTKMVTTGGNIRLSSSGDINLYTVENRHNFDTDTQTKKKFLGIRYKKEHDRWQKNQILSLPASLTANYIRSNSQGNTTLEGTQFSYLSGATIKAGEKLTLLAATNALYEHSIKDDNYVVWQSKIEQGKYQETAILPSFTGSSRPNFIADGGIEVQIPISEKDAQKHTLKEQILELSTSPEYSYLSELVTRNDIDWQEIILTDKEWNYKQQGLTEAGAALVAIAVAAATGGGAGSSLSAFVASSATNAGIAAGTAGTLGAMSSAAFSSLVSTASISLINNQGDIKATLKELGSNDVVKRIVTSAVTAGLLERIGGTQWMQKLGKDTQTTLDDKIFKNLIDSTASALVQTGIQGGSLSNNLENALKSGLATAIQGEAATYIKGLEDANYLLHKIAHAVAGCVAGVLQKDCESGAIGAAVGEMVAELASTTNYFYADDEEKIQLYAQLAGGVVAAYTGYDVDIATKSAKVAVENNNLRLLSSTGKILAKVYRGYKKLGKKATSNDIVRLLKEQGADKLIGIAGDLYTVFGKGHSSSDRLIAAIDLVIGADFNNKGKTEIARKSAEITSSFRKHDKYALSLATINKTDFTKLNYRQIQVIFDNLSPKEFAQLWSNAQAQSKIVSVLRKPGGYHEWMMVAKADKFQRWGVRADEVWSYRTKIKNLTWIIPKDLPSGGQKGAHGHKGSGAFHYELGVLIDNSRNLQEFRAGLIKLGQRWSIPNIPLPK